MPATVPWTPTADPLVFEKELLPVGEITRWVGDDREVQLIDVKPAFQDKLVEQFRKFKEVGVRVPLFATHKEHPDNDRGTVEDLEIKQNPRGQRSVYARVRFNDKRAAEQGKNNDVSVGCPPTFVDAKNNRYMFPLRHVALTSYPVVPGLEPFKPIILSFDTPSGLLLANDPNPDLGGSAVNPEKWAQLLSMLSVAPTPDNPDAELDAVIAAVQALQSSGNNGGGAPVKLSFPPVMVAQMRRTREQFIDGLVNSTTVTPALAAELKKSYCTDAAVTSDLALSADESVSGDTEYDRAIALVQRVAKDRPLAPVADRKKINLSTDDESTLPATVRDARRRAAKASAKK